MPWHRRTQPSVVRVVPTSQSDRSNLATEGRLDDGYVAETHRYLGKIPQAARRRLDGDHTTGGSDYSRGMRRDDAYVRTDIDDDVSSAEKIAK